MDLPSLTLNSGELGSDQLFKVATLFPLLLTWVVFLLLEVRPLVVLELGITRFEGQSVRECWCKLLPGRCRVMCF